MVSVGYCSFDNPTYLSAFKDGKFSLVLGILRLKLHQPLCQSQRLEVDPMQSWSSPQMDGKDTVNIPNQDIL